MTKAENVQFLPWMAASTSSTTSDGKRMVLLVVGGVEGILNFPINLPRNMTDTQKGTQLGALCLLF